MNALDKAIYDYHNTTKTVDKILEEYKISKSTFYRHLDFKEEWRLNNKSRKYSFNFEKFKIDSQNKFYWIGFLSADGAIVKNSLKIELKDIDKVHLEKFNAFFENLNPIKERINNNNVKCVRTEINSSELVKYLKNYNIIQNKSKVFTIPIDKIPNEYIMDYIRGLIDGDGCIRINNHQQISLSFCSGNRKCVEQFAKIINLENKIKKDGNTYSIQVTGNIKAKNILDKIYANSSDENRLERKYSIYKTLN